MRRLLAFATVLLLSAPAWADWDDGDCIRCDLSGADLRGANLDGVDLSDSDLGNVTLSGAVFCNTAMPDGTVLYSGC